MKYLLISLVIILGSCVETTPKKTAPNEPTAKETSDITTQIDVINEALKQLTIKKDNCRMDLVVSKKLPNKPEETIIILPEIINLDEEDRYYIELKAHIVIVDTATGKIKYHYSENDNWISDAIKLAEIKIDTAPYTITETERAFGVRVYYYNSSQPNPYSNETISLYLKNGNTLQLVLDSFPIMEYHGETDTNCYGQFTKEEKLLLITNKKSNDYFDILSKNKTSSITRYPDNDGVCQENETVEKSTKTLKFNGELYQW